METPRGYHARSRPSSAHEQIPIRTVAGIAGSLPRAPASRVRIIGAVDGRPIGVFDSGVGGLTVLHELLVTLPHEDVVYLGDNARLPYGPRPLAEIRRFALEIGRLLEPEARAAALATRNRRVGLLATEATVSSGRYDEAVLAHDASVEVVSVPCPRLVPLIEGPDPFGEETTEAVREVAAPLQAAAVDTVILGCTHYPILRPIFQRVFGRSVTLVFSADETAREVAETLARKGIENDEGREGFYRFLTTGDPAAFREMGKRFLQLPISEVEHVRLQAISPQAA